MALVVEVIIKGFPVFARCGNDVRNRYFLKRKTLGEAYEGVSHQFHGVD